MGSKVQINWESCNYFVIQLLNMIVLKPLAGHHELMVSSRRWSKSCHYSPYK